MAKSSNNCNCNDNSSTNTRNNNMKKVLTFGTFDLAHPGHISYLEEAKTHGDYLITIIARDKNLKKDVINSEEKRLKQIKKLNIANEVVLGSLESKLDVIHKYKPDIICLGYDQKADEAKLAEISNAKIIRCKSFKPHVFKSKILKKNI